MLDLPRFKGVTPEAVHALVAADLKGRFELRGGGGGGGDGDGQQSSAEDGTQLTMIRACQGHTLQGGLDDEAMLTRVTTEDYDAVTEAVHGTTMAAWETIREQGLSRMRRRHVHLAMGLPGVRRCIFSPFSFYFLHLCTTTFKVFCFLTAARDEPKALCKTQRLPLQTTRTPRVRVHAPSSTPNNLPTSLSFGNLISSLHPVCFFLFVISNIFVVTRCISRRKRKERGKRKTCFPPSQAGGVVSGMRVDSKVAVWVDVSRGMREGQGGVSAHTTTQLKTLTHLFYRSTQPIIIIIIKATYFPRSSL